MPEKQIKRELLVPLVEDLKRREITLITGARQVGKTTLMRQVQQKLEKEGKKSLFLSLDIERDRPFFQSQMSLKQKIELELGQEGVVFIDEIQRKENAGLYLKGLFDMELPHKLVVSGSGSLELKEKIHESLAGRKRVFEIYPVSFSEFCNFRTGYRYETRLNDFFQIEALQRTNLLEEYLKFGGYPRIILEETLQDKLRSMDEIFSSYVEKDLRFLLNIDKPEAFISLMSLLASQIGSTLNHAELSNTIGLSAVTVKQYLWYAEMTFTLAKCTPSFTNKRKEITKSPKMYFTDLGMRNFSLGRFGLSLSPAEMGPLFENFVFIGLQSSLQWKPAVIHFWRSKDRAEVDFVVEIGEEKLPIEVKYTPIQKPVLTNSSRSYIDRYHPPQFYVATSFYRGEMKLEETQISFLPFWELFEKLKDTSTSH